MKIAMVSEHASPLALLGGVDAGGQNVHVGCLADELVHQGHEVVVHTRRDDPRPARRERTPGGALVDHVDAGPPLAMPKDQLLPFMEAFADDLRSQWELDPPDVVHAHFWMSGLASVSAAVPLGIPVVQTFHALGAVKRRHQGADDTSPPARQAVEESLVHEADHVIATCRDEVCELVRLGAAFDRISVVPCGVDLTKFSPLGPVATRTPGMRRLLVVGRLVERKGIGDVVAATAALPAVELVIAGGPGRPELGGDPDAVRIGRLADRLGVANRVRMLGRVARKDLPSLIRSADAVVTVPYYEPFGMVALEAMACGVPVVASRVGGLAESVVDGETGVLVPPQDPQALAGVLERLLADGDLRSQLGRAGAERAHQRYGWPTVASATLAVYGKIARRPAVGTEIGR